jgi:hypothetical protein
MVGVGSVMIRFLAMGGVALSLLAAGCGSTGPLFENPVLVRGVPPGPVTNPVYIPLGTTGDAYRKVFETVIDELQRDEFTIAEANAYAGLIRTHPRVSPGLEQFFKPGSPDFDERLLATFQSLRSYVVVKIDGANDGGFWLDVKVYKELEDVDRPIRASAGAAAFRSDNGIERQEVVIEPVSITGGWIPIGEDVPFEQLLLGRLKMRL